MYDLSALAFVIPYLQIARNKRRKSISCALYRFIYLKMIDHLALCDLLPKLFRPPMDEKLAILPQMLIGQRNMSQS